MRAMPSVPASISANNVFKGSRRSKGRCNTGPSMDPKAWRSFEKLRTHYASDHSAFCAKNWSATHFSRNSSIEIEARSGRCRVSFAMVLWKSLHYCANGNVNLLRRLPEAHATVTVCQRHVFNLGIPERIGSLARYERIQGHI